jgi:predicted nucleic acid-binding protein
MILIDANVLIDVNTNDPVWADWSQRQMEIAATQDELAINDVIYAELSIRFPEIDELDAMLGRVRVTLAAIPRLALFRAGKAYQRYRAAGGIRTGVLPDFFIGAHAITVAAPLITRDVARYRTYFPGIRLITPI